MILDRKKEDLFSEPIETMPFALSVDSGIDALIVEFSKYFQVIDDKELYKRRKTRKLKWNDSDDRDSAGDKSMIEPTVLTGKLSEISQSEMSFPDKIKWSIVDLLENRQSVNLVHLAIFFHNFSFEINSVKDQSKALQFDQDALARFLKEITPLIPAMKELTEENFMKIFSALKLLNPDLISREFLLALNEHLKNPALEFSALNLTIMFNNLQNFNSSIVPQELLSTLTARLKVAEPYFNGQALSLLFFGLKNLDSSVVSADLMLTITEKIEHLTEKFAPRSIGMIFYSLKRLDSSVVPRRLLEILTQKIEECEDSFSMRNLSMIFYGLQNLDNTLVPPHLIVLLEQKIQAIEIVSEAEGISPTALGQERQITEIASMTDIIKPTAEELSRFFGDIGYGVQNLDQLLISESFFQILGQKMEPYFAELSLQSISMLLFGLIGFVAIYPSANNLIQKLFVLLSNPPQQEFNQINTLNLVQVFALYQKPLPEWIQESYQPTQIFFLNVTENMAKSILKKRFPRLTIEYNTLLNGFERDLYLPEYKLNFELDGKSHRWKRRRDFLRDQHFLQQHQIETIRLDIFAPVWQETLIEIILEKTASKNSMPLSNQPV